MYLVMSAARFACLQACSSFSFFFFGGGGGGGERGGYWGEGGRAGWFVVLFVSLSLSLSLCLIVYVCWRQ